MSPYSRIELNRLIDSGAKFTVSTGRTPATIRESLPGIHLKLPVIAMDGAVLYDLNENSYLMKYQMSTSQAQTICDFLDRKGISYFTNCVVDAVIAVACCFCVFYLRNREGIPFYLLYRCSEL